MKMGRNISKKDKNPEKHRTFVHRMDFIDHPDEQRAGWLTVKAMPDRNLARR